MGIVSPVYCSIFDLALGRNRHYLFSLLLRKGTLIYFTVKKGTPIYFTVKKGNTNLVYC